MSVALIESFDEWFLSLSKDSGTTRRNDCYTKCGGFDKLNHRNANLLGQPLNHENTKKKKESGQENLSGFFSVKSHIADSH